MEGWVSFCLWTVLGNENLFKGELRYPIEVHYNVWVCFMWCIIIQIIDRNSVGEPVVHSVETQTL
jgi:hypothetical protein